MPGPIVVQQRIRIEAPPEVVWDFTQDYTRRLQWDPSLLSCEVLEREPRLRVAVRAPGALQCVFEYRLLERPHRTSVAMTEVRSALVAGGGGAWTYRADGGGTWWEVTNSITLKSRLAGLLLGPLIRWQLGRTTRVALQRAKRAIEAGL